MKVEIKLEVLIKLSKPEMICCNSHMNIDTEIRSGDHWDIVFVCDRCKKKVMARQPYIKLIAQENG